MTTTSVNIEKEVIKQIRAKYPIETNGLNEKETVMFALNLFLSFQEAVLKGV